MILKIREIQRFSDLRDFLTAADNLLKVTELFPTVLGPGGARENLLPSQKYSSF
jgi:hypothetical protein